MKHSDVESVFRQVTFGPRAVPRVAGLKARCSPYAFQGPAVTHNDALARMRRVVLGKKLPKRRQEAMLRDLEQGLRPYLALVFPVHAAQMRTRPLVRLKFDEATGIGLYAARRLNIRQVVQLDAMWSHPGAVTRGVPASDARRKRRGSGRERRVLCGYRNNQRTLSGSAGTNRRAGDSEAYQPAGACESIRMLSGPASYINDGCSKCANMEAVDGTFTKWRCTRVVKCGEELRMRYDLDLTGVVRPSEPQDNSDEYICCAELETPTFL